MELELLDKTITANNGLKFADIFNYEDDILLICFAMTSLAWKQDSNGKHTVYVDALFQKRNK